MSDEPERKIAGRRITIDERRSVALFQNVEPDSHGLLFVNDGVETRLKVSTEALTALVELILTPDSEWTTGDTK